MSQSRNQGYLLIMTIQIDEQRTGRLEIFEDDDPELLAISFCNQEKLSSKVIPLLMEQIKNNIAVALKERANMIQYLEKKKQAGSELKSAKSMPVQDDTPSPIKKQNSVVFDRLYQNAQQKKLKEQHLLSSQKSNSYIKQGLDSQESDLEYIQKLYERGMKTKEQLQLKADDAKMQKELSQFNECTYKPQINQHSAQLAQRPSEPVGEHLNKLAKLLSGKKEMALMEKVMEEQQQCSFHPQIDKQSQLLVDEKKQKSQIQVPHFEQLYMDKGVQKYRLREREEQFFREKHTFQPKIDQESEKLMKGLSFQERQQKFSNKKLDRNQSAEGSFRPKTGRAPQFRPDNIYNSLYTNAQTLAEKKNELLSKSVEISYTQSKVRASHQSELIFQQSASNTISQIFDLLDSDQDGEIDSLRLDTSTVDPSTLSVLLPLLEQMEIEKCSLSKEQFVQIVTKFMTKLSNKEKHDLLKKQNTKKEQPSFRK